MEPKYSIIIPHYNIPDLLMRCLKSIPVMEEIEVIVVDDNSPDAATYIEKYPELSRPHLAFIRTTKGGEAGYARNVGMEHARGNWLLFADADDLFVDNMYDIISQWFDSDADVVFFKNRIVSSDYLNHVFSGMNVYNDCIDKCITLGDERFVRLMFDVPWGKLIKSNFVENRGFRFDEVTYGNDAFFSFCTGYYARKVDATDTILYVHTRRTEPLSGTFCSKPGELAVRADVKFRIQKKYKELRIDFEPPRTFMWYLMKLWKRDKMLFRYYWRRVDEAYPSKFIAFQKLTKGRGKRFKVKLGLYSLWIWLQPLSNFRKA